MSELNSEIAPQVIEACTTNAEEAAGAIGRTFDAEFVVKPGNASTHATDSPALVGPGLAVLFKFGEIGAIAVLAESTGLVPPWCQAPDPTGESKLSTLAQELSMLLMPDDLMADDFQAAWVEDLSAAVGRATPADDAAALPIDLAQGETLGELRLIWPLTTPDALFSAAVEPEANVNAAEDKQAEKESEKTGAEATPAEPAEQKEKTAAIEAPKTVSQAKVHRWSGPAPRDFRDLPPNTRSVLRVEVPVSVNLASKKAKIEEIVELGPGAIITFDKACDDILEISVAGQPVAMGEAVKVGEKFGVRVREMILPVEHFRPMLPPKAS